MNDPKRPCSQKRKITTTIFVVLFFAFCIFQAYGEQENWPFSYFGMYKRNVSRYGVTRADVEVTTSTGQIINVYNLGVNGYYLEENFRLLIESKKEGRANDITPQLLKALRTDIVPILEKNKIDPEGTVRVRFRYWNKFELSRRFSPDIDEVHIEKRWKDL